MKIKITMIKGWSKWYKVAVFVFALGAISYLFYLFPKEASITFISSLASFYLGSLIQKKYK